MDHRTIDVGWCILFLLYLLRVLFIIILNTWGNPNEKIIICISYFMYNHRICIRVPGYVFARTGQERCQESKHCCKMHHPRRQGFKSNMFTASLCKMYGHGHKQTLCGLATMERFTQSIQTIPRLEIGGMWMLSRQRSKIKNPAIRGIFISGG